MANDIWLQARERVWDQVVRFAQDTGNVFQALHAWGILFLLLNVLLGLLPILAVMLVSGTVDAMIGARGIGVVTSDVTGHLNRWLSLLIVGFLTYLFAARFTGKSGEVGRGIRDIVTISSLLIFFVSINQIFLVFIALLVLLVDSAFSHDMRVRIAGLLVVLLTGSVVAQSLVRFTVLRSLTVGEGLSMLAAVAVLFFVFKMRLARSV